MVRSGGRLSDTDDMKIIKKEQRKSLIDALTLGHNIKDACTIANVSREWFYNELEKNPEWVKAVDRAALALKERMMVRVQNASRDTKKWTAAAWMLERRFPEEYAFTTKHNLEGAAGSASTFADALLAALTGKPRKGRGRKRS